MNRFLKERTINGKLYDIHDILPYVGSYCAEHGFYNVGEPDWFPSEEEWTIVLDWLNTFAEIPFELSDLGYDETQEFFEALAKDYVGSKEPLTTKPDPDFWKTIAKRYPMCHVKID